MEFQIYRSNDSMIYMFFFLDSFFHQTLLKWFLGNSPSIPISLALVAQISVCQPVLSFCTPNNYNNLRLLNALPLHFPTCPSINSIAMGSSWFVNDLTSSYFHQLSPNISFWIDRYRPFTITRIFTEKMRSCIKTFQNW